MVNIFKIGTRVLKISDKVEKIVSDSFQKASFLGSLRNYGGELVTLCRTITVLKTHQKCVYLQNLGTEMIYRIMISSKTTKMKHIYCIKTTIYLPYMIYRRVCHVNISRAVYITYQICSHCHLTKWSLACWCRNVLDTGLRGTNI